VQRCIPSKDGFSHRGASSEDTDRASERGRVVVGGVACLHCCHGVASGPGRPRRALGASRAGSPRVATEAHRPARRTARHGPGCGRALTTTALVRRPWRPVTARTWRGEVKASRCHASRHRNPLLRRRARGQ
jgi:hypothetical protein